MLRRLTTGWVLLAALAASTSTVEAQLIPRPAGCQRCGTVAPVLPVAPPAIGFNPACGCRVPVVQQQLRPVVGVQYRPQQVVTWQDVVTTQIRQEQQIVSVPVTTTRQVTVDEGSYRMVWVPNMVTRQIAETTLQQQVRQQDVPYQVVERVPQVQTQLVPQQTVHYVPEYRTVFGAPVPVTAGVPAYSPAPVAMAPQTPAIATPTPVAQAPAPAPVVTAPQTADSSGEWKSIPQRQANAADSIQQQSFERRGLAEPRRMFSPGVPTAVRAYPGMVR